MNKISLISHKSTQGRAYKLLYGNKVYIVLVIFNPFEECHEFWLSTESSDIQYLMDSVFLPENEHNRDCIIKEFIDNNLEKCLYKIKTLNKKE